MENKKEKVNQFLRFLGKYMVQKCENPGAVLFFKYKNEFLFTLFDDAIFVSDCLGAKLEDIDCIPLVVIPKKMRALCARKISAQNRTVRIQNNAEHLSLVVDHSRDLHRRDDG